MLWWKAAMLSLCTLLQICAGGAGSAATKNQSHQGAAAAIHVSHVRRASAPNRDILLRSAQVYWRNMSSA
ncbi:MAG TPA: hypothetical protein VF800_05465 [Telluria sp.]